NNDIRNLTQRIKTTVSNNFNTINRKKQLAFSQVVEDSAKKAILMRETQNEMASYLRDTTQNWERDFDRISDYVLHEAYDNGRAQSIIRTKGEQAKVYKTVYQ